MRKQTTLALDLEGTLISNAVSQIPRPELNWFLNSCKALFDRIVIYTAVDETLFRNIALLLINEQLAPDWLLTVEYINWDRKIKDLLNIPGVQPQNVLLVDDREEYIHPNQKDQWIKINPFESPYEISDQELRQTFQALVQRANADR